ncbi:MAG TPA: hypothetical protein VMY98_04870 [Anaerolineae bacterium]|nr:hypothetical protein [Anaerolineae bacterium]
MSKAAKSVHVFGLYLVLPGIGFLLIPNVLLTLSGAPTTDQPWIRVVGLLVLALGYYYVQAARKDLSEFFPFTVHTRAALFLVFAVFVLLRLAPRALIVFGVVDLAGAIWTQRSLRS